MAAKRHNDSDDTVGEATVISAVEVAAKLVIGSIGAAYAIGLLIVNLHFRRFGLVTFDLIQAEYVAAGILCLASLIVGRTCGVVAAIFTTWIQRAWSRRRFLVAFLTVPFGMAAVACVAAWPVDFLSGHALDILTWSFWLSAGMVAAMPILMMPLIKRVLKMRLILYARSTKDDWSYDPAVMYEVLVFLIMLSVYSSVAHARFLPAYGGGKPSPVQVVVREPATTILTKAGYTRGELGFTARLLTETDRWLVLTLPSAETSLLGTRTSLRLSRELVDSIVPDNNGTPPKVQRRTSSTSG